MAVQYITRPYTISKSNTTSATLTEETGTTNDNRIIVARTVTAGSDGKFIGTMGTVTGRDVSLQVVSFDRKTESYKSDHEDADAFERSVTDGTGSSSTSTMKGGQYSTATVGEEMLSASSFVVRYRVGASAPRAKSQTYTPAEVVIDLCPYTTHGILANSVLFRWMGTMYRDQDGIIYRGWTDTTAGIACGRINYETGLVTIYDYVVGGTGPSDFQLLSLWTQATPWTTASLFFNTDASPLRPGPGGFFLSVVDTQGTTLTANVDVNGNITGLHMRGKVDFSRGGVELQFGDFVPDTSLTQAQKDEWWYAAADVGAVEPGKVWRPWPVLPDTLSYTAVSKIWLPVDVELMGLDPAALPADGRVIFVHDGETCTTAENFNGPFFAPAVDMVYNVGRQRLSMVQVLGPDGAEIFTGYEQDLDAGTVKFTNLANYPATVQVVARAEVYRQIAEVRIDGRVRLSLPIGYEFPAGAVFSTALRQGDRFARAPRYYSQKSWNRVTWYDGLDPGIGESTAKFRGDLDGAIVVNNRGTVTERWALQLRANKVDFDFIGQHFGYMASGSVNSDFAPVNPNADGAPFLSIPAYAFNNQSWIEGNTIFIDTVGAENQIALVRCTQPSSPVGIDDNFWLVQRGDVNRKAANEV